MRPFLRALLASTLIAAATIPVVAGAAAAAPAERWVDVTSETWCWPSEAAPQYCFDVQGRFTAISTGSNELTIAVFRDHTVAYENGVPVSDSFVTSVSQWRAHEKGDLTLHEIEHSRFVSDDLQCVATYRLRVSDYEVVFENWQVSCH